MHKFSGLWAAVNVLGFCYSGDDLVGWVSVFEMPKPNLWRSLSLRVIWNVPFSGGRCVGGNFWVFLPVRGMVGLIPFLGLVHRSCPFSALLRFLFRHLPNPPGVNPLVAENFVMRFET